MFVSMCLCVHHPQDRPTHPLIPPTNKSPTPRPTQIEYSTDKKRLIMGTGDIQLSIDELNLCLEY